MSNSSKGTEWKVGLFIVLGLAVTTILAITFGKVGSGLKKFYRLKVEFHNASGLLKGNDVYLAGDRVGYAEEAPSLVEGKFAVVVPLRIRDGVKIPKSAKFLIGSSGLMGDAYVAIEVPADANFEDAYQDGDYIMGSRIKGLGDLTSDAGTVLEELRKRLEDLRDPIKQVNEQVLSEANVKNLEQSFANLRDLTGRLKDTAGNLDDVVAKAKSAADTLNEAMNAAKNAMGRADGVVKKFDDAAVLLKPALTDFSSAARSATKAVDSARSLLAKANSGQGALGLLLSDRETSDNLKALIRNLKQRGVLFYRDKVEETGRSR
jgi:phospholipid/cholesterol/gamma-HCH transport system substrate-binding protein